MQTLRQLRQQGQFLEILQFLDQAGPATNVKTFGGPLLPQSKAPGILGLGQTLQNCLCQAVLHLYNPKWLFTFSNVLPHNQQLIHKLLETLPSPPRLAPTGGIEPPGPPAKKRR